MIGKRMAPLAGIRVVELAGLGAAPFCGMILADYGANVLVIDRPGPPSPESIAHVKTVDPLSRGKMRLNLDLKVPADRDLLLGIVSRSHVLLESFRPGVMERLGLGPTRCQRDNPQLVYARLTGWGQTGPMADSAGHDPNYAAAAGSLFHSGATHTEPIAPPTLLSDASNAALLTAGISSALVSASRTGYGQVIDASIAEGTSYLSTYAQSFYQTGQLTDQRGKSWLDGAAPWNATYRTRDNQFMVVAAIEPKFYRCFIDEMGLITNPLFEDGEQWITEKWCAQRELLAERFATQDRATWSTLFEAKEACVSAVLTYGETSRHKQFSSRSAHYEIDGQVFPVSAPRFSSTPAHALAPHDDEATAEYLASLGPSGLELAKRLLKS